jgi:hypothetical protein
MIINEGLETLCAKIKEFLSVLLFLVFSEAIFGLSYFKFAFAMKGYEADTEVGSTCSKLEWR